MNQGGVWRTAQARIAALARGLAQGFAGGAAALACAAPKQAQCDINAQCAADEVLVADSTGAVSSVTLADDQLTFGLRSGQARVYAAFEHAYRATVGGIQLCDDGTSSSALWAAGDIFGAGADSLGSSPLIPRMWGSRLAQHSS